MERFLAFFFDRGISQELIVVIVSALPVVELRGSIPLAINVFGFPWHYALLLAIAGNLIPVPILLLFFDAIFRRLRKIGIVERWFQWLDKRTRRRAALIERYERIGLALFVAIPLPATGAWTGSLAANILRLKFKPAFISILIGVCLAGGIVTGFSLLAERAL